MENNNITEVMKSLSELYAKKDYKKAEEAFKNALKKGSITKEEACQQMSHVLDCANIICMEENTDDFEQAVSSAKTPEEIIALFESVELKFM